MQHTRAPEGLLHRRGDRYGASGQLAGHGGDHGLDLIQLADLLRVHARFRWAAKPAAHPVDGQAAMGTASVTGSMQQVS